MRKTNNQHVVPHSSKGWAVKTASSSRATKTFSTQRDAINYARPIAKRTGSEMLIHSRTGRIRERNTYGSDKFPPRG